MNIETYEILDNRYGVKAVVYFSELSMCTSMVKVKEKNMFKDHKNYENLYDKIARKYDVCRSHLDILLLINDEETCDALAGLGGCKKSNWNNVFKEIDKIFSPKKEVSK